MITKNKNYNQKFKKLVKKSQEQIQRFGAESRSIAFKESDMIFRKKFGLPDTEFEITYYHCTYQGKQGALYLTPSYVCFETTSISSLLFDTSKLVMPIKTIVALDKVKGHKLLPGKGSSVKFVLANSTIYQLGSFLSRKQALKDIHKQAAKYGHSIERRREGVQDK
eukprot:TRINITY_DN8293_c0_g1_i1.p1 TRINITY_DN8293_c0_g1~~TRINITY_DN8293_c0_g1_i1.p1  ORF type:complete len:166 (+),score=31.64 TRINITY_DN8293_c0_g1_i1:124-621(+)